MFSSSYLGCCLSPFYHLELQGQLHHGVDHLFRWQVESKPVISTWICMEQDGFIMIFSAKSLGGCFFFTWFFQNHMIFTAKNVGPLSHKYPCLAILDVLLLQSLGLFQGPTWTKETEEGHSKMPEIGTGQMLEPIADFWV